MTFHGDGLSSIIWFLLFFAMAFMYPRLMLSQMIHKIEKELLEFQHLADDSLKMTAGAFGRQSKEIIPKLKRAIEFFAVTPEDTDPYGVVPKFDKIIKEHKNQFAAFVRENASGKDPHHLNNIETAVNLSSGNHQIAKIVKHFLEIVKKYKNFQIAMIINMQLPMIKDYAKAMNKSVKATLKMDPWGDSIGPLVAAELIGDGKVSKLKDMEMAYSVVKINGRRCVVAKADGPGATVGYPGDAMKYLVKKFNPSRIITVDAAGKLEGEKNGSLAEGVGVAMGPPSGPRIDKYYIENVTHERKIPIDAVVVKVGMEEAISWMPDEMASAVPTAVSYVKEKLEAVPKGKTAIILGVGNTVGVGNNKKEIKGVYDKIKKNWAKAKKMKEEEKEKKWWQSRK